MLLDQSSMPILFLLQGGLSIFGPLPAPFLFGTAAGIVRPQQAQIIRPARGTITHTAKDAFLDDFGVGVPQLFLSGTTGYNEPEGFAGLPALVALRALFLEYLDRRQRTAEANLDPDSVVLLYIDTLNLEACRVYPHEFTWDKNATKPLLWDYRMRLSVLEDYLASLVFKQKIPNILPFLRDLGSLGTGLVNLAGRFAGVSV